MRTLILLGISLTSAAAGAEASADVFRSVVTAENLDLGQTAEFPANPALQTLEAARREAFFLSLLGIRGSREESRGGWRTGTTELRQRHLRVAFKEPLPVGTVLGAGGAVSYLKPDAPFPGDVADESQWVSVPLPEGQAGLRVWTFPPGVVTRALRFSFTDTPAHGTPSRSGLGGALILAERLHNLTPEADAYASSQRTGENSRTPTAYRVENLVNELREGKRDPIGYHYWTGGWTAAPAQDLSREHPQWVVLSWPEAKTFSGVGLLEAFAKEIEIDALKSEAAGHPAAAPESAWNKVGAVTWPVWWRPSYTAVQIPFAAPVTTRALRVRIVKTLSNENPDIVGHFERNPQTRNRHVALGGVMAFANLGNKPIPPRPARVEEPPPIKVRYTMPYDGTVALAVDDSNGRRVRNLIADVERAAGEQAEPWDGRDEAGNLVPPGTYTVKGITRQSLHLAYRGTVNVSGNPPWNTSNYDQHGPGGWLSDHAPPTDVVAVGDRIFVSALVAESGHGILACDLDGNKLWGTHRFGGGKGLAFAGFLAQDGGKVYTAGAGWGSYMTVTEIDPARLGHLPAGPGTSHLHAAPASVATRNNFLRLDFTGGDGAPQDSSGLHGGRGLSGLAARDGKLYVAFNHPPLSWTGRTAINTLKVDAKETTLDNHTLDYVLALLRAKDEVIREPWRPAESSSPAQHLRLAFTDPQAIGTLILPDTVEVGALKADAAFPGDLDDDSQWISFAASEGALRTLTAPAGQAATRALRFTFRNEGGKPWRGALRGAHLLLRRFDDVTEDATFSASSGQVDAHGKWETVRENPITPENPASMIVAWPGEQTWRGLALLGAFAKRIAIDAYTGPAGTAPGDAAESAWSNLGDVIPAVRWRPMYRDDYFDARRNVTTRAIRLRVIEPWVKENPDIANKTRNQPTRAGMGGLVVLRHLGDDPPCSAIPAQRISIADIATGKWERHVAVAEPSWPTFDPQGRLLLVSGRRVVRFDPASGDTEPVLPAGAVEDPRGLAFDAQGNLYVADGGPEVVKAFAADGKLLRTIGEPGGRDVGTYTPNRIENPQGIATDARGNLWVAERDFQPKRTSVWSPAGELINEFMGPSAYGGGGFVDPHDSSRIYYAGMEFSLNYETGAWALKRILSRSIRGALDDRDGDDADGQAAFTLTTGSGAPDKPVYLNGRQYMVNDPSGLRCPLLLIGEFRKDRVVLLTVMGNADRWWPLASDPALRRLAGDRRLEDISFAWSDRDGDGLPQPDEVELCETRLDSTYWPTVVNARLEVQMGGRVLKPVEFTACGAPVYEPAAATPRKLPVRTLYATAIARDGRLLINGHPLTTQDATGDVTWTYPNRFVGVHGTHHATEPRPGQLVGPLGFVGQENLPGVGEVFMLSSNSGEWYLFTADGLLAATVWHDLRAPGAHYWAFPKAERGMSLDNVTLGGEHFGGSFQRADDGKYYLVAGHHHNSVVELTGLETLRRQQSTLTITANDLAALEAWRVRRDVDAARKSPPKTLSLTAPPTPIKPDGDLGEWDPGQFTAIGNRGAFAARTDCTNLYVAWRVNSGAPLRNAGDEPNLLFKTGDSVDLQIGADPDADPNRTQPVPGDQRLLIGLFKGKPIGVLYRHRVPGTPEAGRIGFSSPWRTEYVDRIDRLDPANIGVARAPKGYAVEAVVPLELLGLKPQPGNRYKIDFGILSADSGGSVTVARSYWANQATGLVNDAPGEIMLHPCLWGTVRFVD